MTGGYIMDRRMGNTQGLGGIFVGLCAAIGVPSPIPLFLLYTPLQNLERVKQYWTQQAVPP